MSKQLNLKIGDTVSYKGLTGKVSLIDRSERFSIEVEFRNEKGEVEIGYFDLFGHMKFGEPKDQLVSCSAASRYGDGHENK